MEFEEFLRKEADDLKEQITKIEKNMHKVVKDNGFNNFEKLEKLNKRREKLQIERLKIYEMMGAWNMEQSKRESEETAKQHCVLIGCDEKGNSIYFVSIHELNGVVSTANRDEATVLNYEDAMSLQSHFRGREQVWDIDY